MIKLEILEMIVVKNYRFKINEVYSCFECLEYIARITRSPLYPTVDLDLVENQFGLRTGAPLSRDLTNIKKGDKKWGLECII